MKRYLQSKRFRMLVVGVAALASAWAIGAVRDVHKVKDMTEKMKSVCVGRMLIDLPHEARVELYGGWIDGFNIDAFEETEDAFKTRVNAREAEIRATPDRLGGDKNLESVREVRTDSGLMGKIFVHGRYADETTANKGMDGIEHFLLEGVALEAHIHGHGISIDVTAKDYNPDYIEDLPRLVSQLVANRGNAIPTEPGFCIDLAYVRDPLNAKQGERITMSAGLPSHPDIYIKFDTLAGTKPDSEGLIERDDASHARAPALVNMRFSRLRAAPRTIGGMTGDELAQRVLEENFAIVYGFQWEVIGTQDNVFAPDVSLMMKTGNGEDNPVPSSLAQPAALALWDTISFSIRIRPTQAPKVGAAGPPITSPDTDASDGDTCAPDATRECSGGSHGGRPHKS